MKKKILSLIMASAMMLSASAAVLADETNPDVYVDGALITFNDQPAIITDDRTLIPARGVFEAMDAKVTWDGDERTVTINSKDNITRVILTIDSPEMTVYTFTSLLSADTETVTLDVAPQILNDRTMIPLRAVSEALNADVEWDSDSYTVNIVTSDMPESTEGMPTLSLAALETTVEAGEEFDIYINLENIVSDSWLSGLSAVVSYDKENYEFVNASLCRADGTAIDNPFFVANPDFEGNSVKIVTATIDSENTPNSDGYIAKFTFKAVTGDEGVFILSNGYNSSVGFDTYVDFTDDIDIFSFVGNSINIDSSPVIINAAEAE